MVTQKIELHYKEFNAGKFNSVRHYELQQASNSTKILSDKLNVSKSRGYAKSLPVFSLKERVNNKWSGQLTGLFESGISENHFTGDLDSKRHFIICEFSPNLDRLRVVIYPNYYPFDNRLHPTTVGKKTKHEF